MRLTIDTTSEPLADVLTVLGAAYGVDLTQPTAVSSPPSKRTRRSTRNASARNRTGDAKADEVRKWAADNGFKVSSRGALPKVVTEAFAAAQR